MTKESLHLSSGARSDQELLASSFFAPIFKQTSNPNQADAVAIVDYISTHIIPTLLPALVALGKALEDDPSTDVHRPSNDDDRSLRSLPLRTYLSRFVNKSLAKCFEALYASSPDDPVDALSCLLFAASADEPLNPELDSQVQPLVFVAQYLMRHNPRHRPPDVPNRKVGRMFAPFDDSNDFRHSTAADDLSSSLASAVPSGVAKIPQDLSQDLLGVHTRSFPGLSNDGSDVMLTVVASRLATNSPSSGVGPGAVGGGVQYRAFCPPSPSVPSGVNVRRLLKDSTLRLVVPPSVFSGGGLAAAALHLLQLVNVVKVCRGLQIAFRDTPDLAQPPTTLLTTSKRFGDELYIVDVMAEPPLATCDPMLLERPGVGGRDEPEEGDEAQLVRVRMYDTAKSKYYEVSKHAILPGERSGEGGVGRRRRRAAELLADVRILKLDDGEVMFAIRGDGEDDPRGGTAAGEKREEEKEGHDAKEEGKGEERTVLSPLQAKLQNWSLSQKMLADGNTSSNHLASPRLRAALDFSSSSSSSLPPPAGLLQSCSTSSLLCPLPLSSLGAAAARGFGKDDLDRAEAVWQLRRDNALVDKREELVRRAKAMAIGKTTSKQHNTNDNWDEADKKTKKKGEGKDATTTNARGGKGAATLTSDKVDTKKVPPLGASRTVLPLSRSLSVVVFRRGVSISGRRLIVTVECFDESLAGTLRFTAYDPQSCEAFEVVAPKRDTRGLVPGVEGGRLPSKEADEVLLRLCRNLRLERRPKDTGPVVLLLVESDEVKTRLRAAFDALPKDFAGRASRKDVLAAIEAARSTAEDAMPGRGEGENVGGSMGPLLDKVFAAANEGAWPRVSFDEFCGFLTVGEAEIVGEAKTKNGTRLTPEVKGDREAAERRVREEKDCVGEKESEGDAESKVDGTEDYEFDSGRPPAAESK